LSARTIIQTLRAHNITLTLSGARIEMQNGNDIARMHITANRAAIINLLRIKQRGEHDGQCSKSACCSLATINTMATGAHIYAADDDRASYAEGFAMGYDNGVAILTLDEARTTCHSTPCQRWKDTGNEAHKRGATELVAVMEAAQTCRTQCNESKETV